MPTGYTAKLMEEGQTFQEFIMGCARAFGALIEMRDDPADAPIPEKFEPSDYYSKRIVESTEELARLQSMDDAQKEAFGKSARYAAIRSYLMRLRKARNENARLDDMAAQIDEWTPPTQEHQGLKDFMLQQIDVSKNELDYNKTALADAEKKPAMAYYVSAVSEAAYSIKRSTERHAEEIERANERTEWVRQLRGSI